MILKTEVKKVNILLEENVKATVLQSIIENHELCRYAKISLHIHILVNLNQIIA